MTSDRLDVTVAATPPFRGIFRVGVGDSPPGATWDDLPKTTFSVESGETLREVLRTACQRLKVTMEPEVLRIDAKLRRDEGLPPRSSEAADWLVFAAFRRDDDDEVIPDHVPLRKWNTRLGGRVVVVRDAKGHAVWRRPPFDVTMAELVDAHQVDLIDGDPLQIYLIPSTPQGDFGLGGEWNHFVENLKLLWELTDAASRIGGAAGAVLLVKEVLSRRSKRAADAVDRHATDWAGRGAAPADLIQLLASRPRETPEIAELLGCSASEAEAILWALGFALDEATGTWTRAGDSPAQLIADDVDLGFTDVLMSPDTTNDYRDLIEQRLRKFSAKGDPPSFREDRERLREKYFTELGETSRPGFLGRQLRRIRAWGRWVRSGQ